MLSFGGEGAVQPRRHWIALAIMHIPRVPEPRASNDMAGSAFCADYFLQPARRQAEHASQNFSPQT